MHGVQSVNRDPGNRDFPKRGMIHALRFRSVLPGLPPYDSPYVARGGGRRLFGLSLPNLFAAESATGLRHIGQAHGPKSVIFLCLFGGPSQLETFDLKPEAPQKIRSPFKPISCRTPGLRISEALPNLANISDRFCIIRTMIHPFNDHSTDAYYL